MLLGDLDATSTEKLSDARVAYKERIAFATMRASIPDWQPPSDWDSLTNGQKLDRLDKIVSMNYYDDVNPDELASSTSFDFFILGLVIGAVLIAYLLRNNTN